MPFFKFRKKSEETTANTPAPNSVEAIRQRAKHRLIGASVLVLLAVIGFPILFDSQPRPVPVDVSIEIPDKNTVVPLAIKPPEPAASAVSGVIEEAAVAPEKTAPVAQAEVAPVVVAKEPVTPVAEVKPAPAKKEPAPAKKEPVAAGRFVVQIGAFADQPKAREARMKLEKAGFKTYTQVIETKDGRRIRVRVGPFETKAEASKAAEKIKKLDLQAGILEL